MKRKKNNGRCSFNTVLCIYKRTAKERNHCFRLTIKEFKKLTQGNCFYCGIKPSTVMKRINVIYIYNGIDRINNNLGYTKKNCVSCCKVCNRMKSSMNRKEFLFHINKISVKFDSVS